jgi:hypothetical protein
MYYSYHNKIKKLIKEGKLLDYKFADTYNNISPCLILYIMQDDGVKAYPIRDYRWNEYYQYLPNFDSKNEEK